MNDVNFFIQTLVYLSSAIIMVPIANRLGLGSVLGYLIAGIVIGPFVFGFVGSEGKDLLHFAEFGVVMMLFVIGLELELSLLWRLKFWLLGLGGLQILLTTVSFSFIYFVFSYSFEASIALGLIFSLSSTAIVLQTLKEKGLMKSIAGQASFSVLLFQDMAVIPILALFPLLSSNTEIHSNHSSSVIEHFPNYFKTIIIFISILGIIVSGKYLLSPLFRILAKSGNREIFTGASLLLVIGISLLMGAIGLSAALGTFLAGVVLAGSEFRHELESNVEPFKGLLLGLFFLSVGSSMDVRIMITEPTLVFSNVFGIIFIKASILFALGLLFRFPLDQNIYFCLALSQVGEFAFVLFAYSETLGIFEPKQISSLIASVALSMALTPVLLLIYQKVFYPKLQSDKTDPPNNSQIAKENHPVIICGFGRYGNMLGRFLRVNGVPCTILDYDADRIEMLLKFGFKVHFGDATRIELLEAAGIESASVLVAALDSIEKQKDLIRNVKTHFPNIKIFARAGDREEAYELYELGADYIYRETRETAVTSGGDILRFLGIRANAAEKAKHVFLKHDDETFRELFGLRKDRVSYISLAKQRTAELERLMTVDKKSPKELNQDKWNDLERD
ncbi:monovalent cation:proton antiporter-2 (CPA2) family protein [Leptospira sp. 96542]|nr:monovalent cation:proton antiporter-2 (CPA2) family protein [Leptospira sp. 96542]